MDEQQEAKQRKTRSDKGIQILSERDLWLLLWIGDMWAVTKDQLERLLARQPKRLDKVKREGSLDANRLVQRWRAMGLVDYRKIDAEHKPWIWLTKQGLAEMGLPYTFVEPKKGKINHYYWCNEVRIHVEGTERHTQHKRQWRSERELKWGREGGSRWASHPVDAEIPTTVENDKIETIGVEVEVTAKSKERTLEIMNGSLRYYDWLWYFCNGETIPVVKWARMQQTATGKRNVVIFNIEEDYATVK